MTASGADDQVTGDQDHATEHHTGFPRTDPGFEERRNERAKLIVAFLEVMNEAGNPGVRRDAGSLVRQITGQEADESWLVIADDGGQERQVTVYADGRHGWSDEFAYSDRPRSAEDEISPDALANALRIILDDEKVERPEALR